MDVEEIFQHAKTASRELLLCEDGERSLYVLSIADELEANRDLIYKANAEDAKQMNDDDPKKDRLIITPDRLDSIIQACRNIAKLPSPVGTILLDKMLSNGLLLKKVTVPLGVIGAIYESRPNVTIDIAALCLKSGNAAILRGGKETAHSNTLLVSLIQRAVQQRGGNPKAVQLFPTDRAYIDAFLSADTFIDLIIPRGSEALIEYVRRHSRIPTIETGAGVCHTYVHEKADTDKAAKIVDNAKHQRPSVCNALDTILIDRNIAETFLKKIASLFGKHNTGIWADEYAHDILQSLNYPNLHQADTSSFGKEYVSLNCAIKTVAGLDEAISHITKYSSKHSETIVSEDKSVCKRFLKEVDAAVVYSNASTRFTDGEVFGLGAEVGISTQKLHARGPFALEKLVTEKWIAEGDGQVR